MTGKTEIRFKLDTFLKVGGLASVCFPPGCQGYSPIHAEAQVFTFLLLNVTNISSF